MLNNFNYESGDGKTQVHAVEWTTKDKPRAILQIAHGMAEHVMRYAKFAEFLNDTGIYVCGNDHIGHGKSITDKKQLGYFAKENGHKIVVDDMKKLTDLTKEKFPDVPTFY